MLLSNLLLGSFKVTKCISFGILWLPKERALSDNGEYTLTSSIESESFLSFRYKIFRAICITS